MNKKQQGAVFIPANLDNIWEHELATAQALAKAGYVVTFLSVNNIANSPSPDILMDGISWEMKAPRTNTFSAIERNLKRASKQSENIIIDSRRLHGLQDRTIQQFLEKKFSQQKTIKRLLFVNRKREVIDISASV